MTASKVTNIRSKSRPTRRVEPLPTLSDPRQPDGALLPDREPHGFMSGYRQLLELRFPFEGAAFIAMRPLLRALHVAGDRHAVLCQRNWRHGSHRSRG